MCLPERPSCGQQFRSRGNRFPFGGAWHTARSHRRIAPKAEETAVQPSPDIDPELRPLIALATTDLAARLHIDPNAIETLAAVAKTWPDKSVGCPQPGMLYNQVTVDGALIQLRAAGSTYSYHSGGSRPPFLCENASMRDGSV